MSERGVVAMWRRAFGDGRLAVSLELEGGWAGGWRILAGSPQSLMVAGFGGGVCGGGREAGGLGRGGGLRGGWLFPLTVCVQTWQLAPMSSIQPSNVHAQQPCPAH